MTYTKLSVVRCAGVMLLTLLGCSRELTTPTAARTGASTGAVGTLTISADKTTFRVGEEIVLLATTKDAAGNRSNSAVRWTTASPEIVQIADGEFPVVRITGRTAGVAKVTATADGLTQTIGLEVLPRPAPDGSAIVVEDFRVIEFQYSSAPGRWFYAPLVRVRETKNGSSAAILGFNFLIPGLGNSPSCGTYRPVGPGESLDLFREVYGDYGFTIEAESKRATGTTATALIIAVDGSGAPYTIVATGPIISGGLPTTYTGGSVSWSCH